MGLIESYNKANNAVKLNERGFTPFQFSSRKTQINTTQLGGLIPNNPISGLLNESMSWYEMWINPEKININRGYIVKKTQTAGAVVSYHYRPDVETMTVSGVIGWIGVGPQEEEANAMGFKSPDSAKEFYKVWSYDKFKKDPAKNNSPMIFLKRLKGIADEPMYFVGTDGVEHYNTKYIKIYTKQFPTGIVCEGYFTKFTVPESGEDVQTINYDFEFVIETKKTITALQRMAGMWGGGGLGGGMRSIPGLG